MHEFDRIVAAIRNVTGSGAKGIVVTVVRTEGSTYRRAGARAVISESGESWGAISGGCLERDLALRVRPWFEGMAPRLVTYDSTRADDAVFGLGLGCRGVSHLLVEPFDAAHPHKLASFAWNGRTPVPWSTALPDGGELAELIHPPRAVLVFGNGPDVASLLSAGGQLGWTMQAVSGREPFDTGAWDAAVVMTHNFERDAAIVRALLASQIGYIGLLGPRVRGDELLAAAGGARSQRVHSPAGLDLGAETPEEIALSIAAEIQAVFSLRSAKPLRELDTPIHPTVPDLQCV